MPPSAECAVAPVSHSLPSRKRFLLPTPESSSSDIGGIARGRKLFHDFEPSRKRRRTAILATTDALVQRSGSVIPGLLPRGPPPRAARSLAHGMIPFDKALKLAFTSDTHRRAKFTNERPKLTKRLRRRAIARLMKLSSQLLTARLRLTRKQRPKAHARSLNIPLILLLAREPNYAGKNLARDLVYGLGIVGKMEKTNSLALRDIPASINLERTKTTRPARNRPIAKAPTKARNQTLKHQ